MEKKNTGIIDKLGAVFAALALAVSVYGFVYVLAVNGEKLFAIPMLIAVNFFVIVFVLSAAALVMSLIARKKNKKSRYATVGTVGAVAAIAVAVVFVCVGVYSLTLNDFNSLWNSFIYKDGTYSDVVSALFDGLHGDNWTY